MFQLTGYRMTQNSSLKKLVIIQGSEIGAAFGLAQLEKLDDNIKIRQENFKNKLTF